MLAYWTLSSNFGDQLTRWLVEKITGRAPKWTGPDDPRKHIVGAGSILNHARKNSIVWGAGIANMGDPICPEADLRMVRGPLSALRALTTGCKPIYEYGDPGLLCSRYRPAKEKVHELGFIPHYTDNSVWAIDGAYQIDVLAAPEVVMDEISSCKAVISTSLHGLIVADSYGIPAGWLYSPRVLGDGTKFADYMLSVGAAVVPPLRWEDVANKSAMTVAKLIPSRMVKFDQERILKRFPYEISA